MDARGRTVGGGACVRVYVRTARVCASRFSLKGPVLCARSTSLGCAGETFVHLLAVCVLALLGNSSGRTVVVVVMMVSGAGLLVAAGAPAAY